MTSERLRRAPPVRSRGLGLSMPSQVLAVLCLMYLVL
jgi:hypothetical protein